MSQAKFTQGRWERDRHAGLKCDVRAISGRKIALCFGLNYSDKPITSAYRAECDANADLIAAAPTLYEALEKAATVCMVAQHAFSESDAREEAKAIYEQARAALKAARGGL